MEFATEFFELDKERITLVFPKCRNDLVKHYLIKMSKSVVVCRESIETFITLNGGWIKEF